MELTTKAEPILGEFKGLRRLLWQVILPLYFEELKELNIMANSKSDGNKQFQKLPFSTLVKKDKELSGIRCEYALKSKFERRAAADWEYHSEIANDLFNDALAKTGGEGIGRSDWPAAVISLSIDPLYAPAILTVGSIEYQVGRVEKAMNLFLTLTKLPEDEEDLSTIIDKAGDF